MLFQKCKSVLEQKSQTSTKTIDIYLDLKEKFSSEYLSCQTDLMLRMQSENLTEAIGKAKELIESCCKTILEKHQIFIDRKWDISNLTSKTFEVLKLSQKNGSSDSIEIDEIKALLGNLRAIIMNLAALRNQYVSSHGKSANFKSLEIRHAKLAVGSSITLVDFLWDSHERWQEIEVSI